MHVGGEFIEREEDCPGQMRSSLRHREVTSGLASSKHNETHMCTQRRHGDN